MIELLQITHPNEYQIWDSFHRFDSATCVENCEQQKKSQVELNCKIIYEMRKLNFKFFSHQFSWDSSTTFGILNNIVRYFHIYSFNPLKYFLQKNYCSTTIFVGSQPNKHISRFSNKLRLKKSLFKKLFDSRPSQRFNPTHSQNRSFFLFFKKC